MESVVPNSEIHNPVSIVIPTYNRSKTLSQVFESYVVQKKVREIIVVNDCSTDGTEGYVLNLKKKYPKIVYIKNERNLGLPASRNVGVQRASGEFILFGEDDLRFGDDYAEKLHACMEVNGGAIAAGRILYPFPKESDGEVFQRTCVAGTQRIDKRRIMYDATTPVSGDIEVPFIHACSMIRREVFESIQYDPGYRSNAYREETDFYLRAGQLGYKIFYCPHTYCIHLPREVLNLGGTMARGIWVYKYWGLRNNYRFLKRHHGYLRQKNIVEHGIPMLMFFFTKAELVKIFSFYLRKYSPGIYTALAKRLSN